MVKRVHNHCSRWGRNRYYYWVTTFARLPTFMKMGGHVIALPLFMETFAFFFEAIFLSIYLYTWDRFKINGHILLFHYQLLSVVHFQRSL